MVVDQKAKALLARRGYDPVYGARPLKRLISEVILNPLATKILEGQFKDGDTVQIGADDKGELTFRHGAAISETPEPSKQNEGIKKAQRKSA